MNNELKQHCIKLAKELNQTYNMNARVQIQCFVDMGDTENKNHDRWTYIVWVSPRFRIEMNETKIAHVEVFKGERQSDVYDLNWLPIDMHASLFMDFYKHYEKHE